MGPIGCCQFSCESELLKPPYLFGNHWLKGREEWSSRDWLVFTLFLSLWFFKLERKLVVLSFAGSPWSSLTFPGPQSSLVDECRRPELWRFSLAWSAGKGPGSLFYVFLNKWNPQSIFQLALGESSMPICICMERMGAFVPLGPIATCQFSPWPVAPSMKTTVAVGNPESPWVYVHLFIHHPPIHSSHKHIASAC